MRYSRGMRKRRRRAMRLLAQSFRMAGVDKIIIIFIVYFFLAALLMQHVEPGISSYGDSLWYCFAITATVGFGDITAVSAAGRILTVVLSIYSTIVIAIVTAVITSFFLELARLKANDSAKQFLDDLEHLSELSKEELDDLSARLKRFRLKGEKDLDRKAKKRGGSF